MSVIRTIHNKENPYAQLSKKVINDTNLTFEALGLWTWCMSKPNDWAFCITHIAKERKLDRKTVMKIIKELIENNYCYRFQERKVETGKFQPIEYFFFEFKPSKEELCEVMKQYPNFYCIDDLGSEIKEILPMSEIRTSAHNESEPMSAKPMIGFTDIRDFPTTEDKGTQKTEETELFCSPADAEQLSDKEVYSVTKSTPEGKHIVCKKEDLFAHAVKTNANWSGSEIQQAWDILVKTKGPVRDWLAFIDGTIRNLRIKQQAKFSQGESTCHKKKHLKKNDPISSNRLISNSDSEGLPPPPCDILKKYKEELLNL